MRTFEAAVGAVLPVDDRINVLSIIQVSYAALSRLANEGLPDEYLGAREWFRQRRGRDDVFTFDSEWRTLWWMLEGQAEEHPSTAARRLLLWAHPGQAAFHLIVVEGDSPSVRLAKQAEAARLGLEELERESKRKEDEAAPLAAALQATIIAAAKYVKVQSARYQRELLDALDLVERTR